MSELLYHGHGMDVRLETAALPDGRTKTTARLHTCDTVHILALQEDGLLLMLREYRPFYGEYVWMLPSGKVDKETDIKNAAQRELREETGFRAEILTPYFSARHTERMPYTSHVFVARTLQHDPLPQDAEELIEVHPLPIEQALQNVLNAKVLHSISALALLRFQKDNKNSQ